MNIRSGADVGIDARIDIHGGIANADLNSAAAGRQRIGVSLGPADGDDVDVAARRVALVSVDIDI